MRLCWILLSLFVSPTGSLSTPYGAEPRNRATGLMSGAGPVQVDMNQYNLPLDRIEQEWECHLVAKTAQTEGGVRLQCRSNEVFVDAVLAEFPRQDSLGIELLELAGGREDGLGITVVSGIVQGGPAQNCDIQIGDCISQVSVLQSNSRTSGEGLSDVQDVVDLRTEGLGYDATVAALQSLPPVQENQVIQLKLKRLRRRPKVTVNLQFPPSQQEPDTTITLFAGENLRQGMLVRGVKLNDELAKRFDTKQGGNCGAGGLCRTCAVSVLRGQEMLNPQRPAEEQMLQATPRWRLACKAIVGYGMKEGEMTIRVSPNQWDA